MAHRKRGEDWTRGEIGQKSVERKRSPQACLHTPQNARISQIGQCFWSPRFSSTRQSYSRHVTEEKKINFNSNEAARAGQLNPMNL